jgi:hypothetical protein
MDDPFLPKLLREFPPAQIVQVRGDHRRSALAFVRLD